VRALAAIRLRDDLRFDNADEVAFRLDQSHAPIGIDTLF
jgi:hypothetical protein